jgi:hypothetical protein
VSDAPQRRRLWIGRLLLLVGSLAAGTVLLELGAAAVYRRHHGHAFDRAEVQARLLTDRASGSPIRRLAPELAERLEKIRTANLPDAGIILHPYFGFVVNPTAGGVNRYGFFAEPPLVEPHANAFTVALFGGSLTDQVFYMAREALIAALRREPALAARDIRVVSTALGGYKQPQQVNILSFFLARGAAYDVVVNLDGFNEIDAPFENLAAGVNPFFPFNWKLHARRGLDPAAMTLLGRIDLVRGRRAALRQWFGAEPFVHSAFLLTLWDGLDRRLESTQRARVAELSEALDSSGRSPRVRGPAVSERDPSRLVADAVRLWQQTSLQMKAICDAHGIAYVHLLQPNQYLPDSKPLTAEELEHAYKPDEPIRARVTAGYPLLIEAGAALDEAGVQFVDLTMMFADEPRSIYSDPCCHVNELGARLIAERIAAAILAEHVAATRAGGADPAPDA